MLLAIVELGYQSCWIEGHITDTDRIGEKMAQILQIPEDYELVAFLPIGVALEEISSLEKLSSPQRMWFNGFDHCEF